MLVSGEDDVKRLENLNEVLTRISQAELRLRQEKCFHTTTSDIMWTYD